MKDITAAIKFIDDTHRSLEICIVCSLDPLVNTPNANAFADLKKEIGNLIDKHIYYWSR